MVDKNYMTGGGKESGESYLETSSDQLVYYKTMNVY